MKKSQKIKDNKTSIRWIFVPISEKDPNSLNLLCSLWSEISKVKLQDPEVSVWLSGILTSTARAPAPFSRAYLLSWLRMTNTDGNF